MKKERIEHDDSRLTDFELYRRAVYRTLVAGRVMSDAEAKYAEIKQERDKRKGCRVFTEDKGTGQEVCVVQQD